MRTRTKLLIIFSIPLLALFLNATFASGSVRSPGHQPGNPSYALSHPSAPRLASPRVFPSLAAARRASQYEWADFYHAGYMRDPSDGGINTHVLASAFSTSNAEDWYLIQANPGCGNTVTASCPGGPISNAFSGALRGDAFALLENVGAPGSLCYGANAQGSWIGTMGTCDGVSGNHHYNTIFVYDPDDFCSGQPLAPTFWSYQWNKNGNTTLGPVADAAGVGFTINVISNPNNPHCPDLLWGPTAS